MAELADAHGSGPCGSNTMRVQVSFPALESEVPNPLRKAYFQCIGTFLPLLFCFRSDEATIKAGLPGRFREFSFSVFPLKEQEGQ